LRWWIELRVGYLHQVVCVLRWWIELRVGYLHQVVCVLRWWIKLNVGYLYQVVCVLRWWIELRVGYLHQVVCVFRWWIELRIVSLVARRSRRSFTRPRCHRAVRHYAHCFHTCLQFEIVVNVVCGFVITHNSVICHLSVDNLFVSVVSFDYINES